MTANSVRASTVVPIPPDTAFTLFTSEIDAWWRRSNRHRSEPAASIIRFQDDRLVEVSDEGSTELGLVLAWQPGARLVLAWHGPHWAASSAGHTEVEITFEPDGDGTRVTVEHRGWTGVETGDAAAAVIGLWWGDLLAGYAYRADHPEPARQR